MHVKKNHSNPKMQNLEILNLKCVTNIQPIWVPLKEPKVFLFCFIVFCFVFKVFEIFETKEDLLFSSSNSMWNFTVEICFTLKDIGEM